MILRSGSGRCLTSVGAAMICSSFANSWLLVDVHDFQVVPALEMLVANLADVPDRARRSRAHARHVQPKHVSFGPARADRSARRSP